MDKIQDFKVNSPRWRSLENFEGEVWRDIVGFEGLYQVSNLGRIRTKYDKVLYTKPIMYYRPKPIIIVKQTIDKDGYLKVGLTKNKKCSHHSVHRLVATAFLPNKQNYPCINHKDENKQNNRVDNLEWCSFIYNNNYGTIKARISATHRIKAYNGIAIVFFNKEGKFISEFPSIKEAERFMPISRSCLKNNKNGKLIGDYIFFHKDHFSKEKLEVLMQDIESYKIIQLTKNGDIVKLHNSIREASDSTGIQYSKIYFCCKHIKKFKSAGGYVWLYNKEYINSIQKKTDIKKFTIKDNSKRKKVYQFTVDGKYIATYASVREAGKITHISSSTICEVCNEKSKVVTAGGFIWTYKMNASDVKRKIERAKLTCNKKVAQYSIDNNFIASYGSIKEASEKTGISHSVISQCVCKRKKTGGGFIWKYNI